MTEIPYEEAEALRRAVPGPSLAGADRYLVDRSLAIQIRDLDAGRLVVLEQDWSRPQGEIMWSYAKPEDVSSRLLYDGDEPAEALAAARAAVSEWPEPTAGFERPLTSLEQTPEDLAALIEVNRRRRHGPQMFAAPLPPAPRPAQADTDGPSLG